MGLITSMREWLMRREAPTCPKCREELTEWDAILRRFVCNCCSYQWAPSPPRSAA
jgi:uncharacterized Zn ribbon protein